MVDGIFMDFPIEIFHTLKSRKFNKFYLKLIINFKHEFRVHKKISVNFGVNETMDGCSS